ncbi:MAG: cyclodeaminase/cyclohydrolase family protein, partial [Myxococcota bacterium]
EVGCAQVSMNLTDIEVTPLHLAFDTADERARERGLRVTGSELVGLVPKLALLEAGRHYLAKMGRSTGVPEAAVLHTAVRSLGLEEIKPFDLATRVIENRLAAPAPLAQMTLRAFVDELSSDSPAPGGGSVSALAGSLAAGLAAMVANLSHPRKGFESKQERLEAIAVRAQALKDELLAAVDADTQAFDALLAAMRLPKESDDERSRRNEAMRDATVAAIEVPLGVLERAPEVIALCREIGAIGLAASKSDAGVGVQMARAAAAGAYQNVCINLASLGDVGEDAALREKLVARADAAWEKAQAAHVAGEREILVALRAGVPR